jgi:hypothetical protein
MIGSVETITPAQARAMLDKNGANRPTTRTLIRRYAHEMQAGRWNTNGQGIILAPDGTLLDGQHRLHAIVMANLAVEMFVVRGVPQERFETMDSGRARTVGDVLGAQNYAYSTLVAALARLAWNYAAGTTVNYGAPKAALVQFVHNHPSIADLAAKIGATETPLPRSPLGSVLFLANEGHGRYQQQADSFLSGVKTGEDMKKGDPRLSLREWYFYHSVRTAQRATLKPEVVFTATARAWNAYVTDRDLSLIKQLEASGRKSILIEGFELEQFSDVEDLSARLAESRQNNLAQGPGSVRRTA